MHAKQVTSIKVVDYSAHYGGAGLVIDGRECTICSVVGYALYNGDCPATAVTETLRKMKEQPFNGHKMVWISLCATVMTGDREYNNRAAAAREAMPQLKTGDLIRFEGKTYAIAPDHNRNFRLVEQA